MLIYIQDCSGHTRFTRSQRYRGHTSFAGTASYRGHTSFYRADRYIDAQIPLIPNASQLLSQNLFFSLFFSTRAIIFSLRSRVRSFLIYLRL